MGQVWVFWAAPIAGAVLAGVVWKLFSLHLDNIFFSGGTLPPESSFFQSFILLKI